MTNKKKANRVVLIILAIALAIFFLNYFDVLKLPGLSVASGELTRTGTNIPYICPEDVSQCSITGGIECNEIHSEDKVIFRTNADTDRIFNTCTSEGERGCTEEVSHSYTECLNGQCVWRDRYKKNEWKDKWIAINTGLGMNGYGYDTITSTIGSNGCKGNIVYKSPGVPMVISDGRIVYYLSSSNKVYLCGNSNSIVFEFSDSSDIDRDSTEKCQDGTCEEITSGDVEKYSCSGDLMVNGNIIKHLSCSSDYTPCEKEFTTTVQPNDLVSVVGGDDNFIESQTFKFPDCSVSKCNTQLTGFFNCNDGDLETTLNLCDSEFGEICADNTVSGASCNPPFSVSKVEFINIGGKERDGYTPSDSIFAKVSLVSSRINSGDVVLRIWKGDEPKRTYNLDNFNFNSNIPINIQLTNPSEIGNYYATLDVSYLGRTINIGEKDEFDFRISIPIVLSMNVPYSPVTGSALYTNSNVFLDLKVSDENGDPISTLTNSNFNDLVVKFNNVIQPNPNFVTPLPEDGLYRFIFNSQISGVLDVNAKVNRQGISSNEVSFSSTINNPKIEVVLTNIGLYRSIPPSIQNIEFETKSSFEEFVDTINVVKVTPPGCSIPSCDKDVSGDVVRESTGKYSFDFNFEEIGGYSIKIESSAEGFEVGDVTNSGSITVTPGGVVDDCVETEDCRVGEVCRIGKCVKKDPPITLYLIIGASIIFAIILIFLILKFRRKKTIDIGL